MASLIPSSAKRFGVKTVEDMRESVRLNKSLTAAIPSKKIYPQKEFRRIARRREVNLTVISDGNGEVMVKSLPLFSDQDIADMRQDSLANKFVHIGLVTVSVEPLIHNQYLVIEKGNMTGMVALFDSMFNDLPHAIIAGAEYDLAPGRAHYAAMPNHFLSLTDGFLKERLCLLFSVSGIRCRKDIELFNICVGYEVTCTNTMELTNHERRLIVNQIFIEGTKTLEENTIKNSAFMDVEAIREHFDQRAMHIQSYGEDDVIVPKAVTVWDKTPWGRRERYDRQFRRKKYAAVRPQALPNTCGGRKSFEAPELGAKLPIPKSTPYKEAPEPRRKGFTIEIPDLDLGGRSLKDMVKEKRLELATTLLGHALKAVEERSEE